jgi:hypothetical protein
MPGDPKPPKTTKPATPAAKPAKPPAPVCTMTVRALVAAAVAAPAEARADFDALVRAPPVLGMHRQGLKANERCAAEHALRAHRVIPHNGVARPTLERAWACPRLRAKVLESAARLFPGVEPTPRHVVQAYKLLHGSISLFRPMAAKYLFSQYSPRGRVLDFCAGWGGRLLGALATPGVVSYVGIDSNPELRAVYDCLGRYNPGKDVKIVSAPAETVDFRRLGRFDCVVTSPPYYGIEVYRHMPQYGSHDAWLKKFLFPVLAKVTRHIDPDGAVCINIRQPPTERAMVAEMRRLGWRVARKLLYRLPAMPGKGSHQGEPDYGEPVYVFRKAPAARPPEAGARATPRGRREA